MRKVYREEVIRGIFSGIVIGVGFTIFVYLIRGEVVWSYLFLYPISFAIGHLIRANLRERREAKKEEKDQPSRKF
jgi:RsiW-degrading membrane proteinase PrsW (M82 family)